jgi:DNA-directed RNA polymerase subunit RPC12/RpoP
MKRKLFVCTHCGLEQRGIMTEAGHRCIKNRNRWTLLKEQCDHSIGLDAQGHIVCVRCGESFDA